jgi:hypothetical protein
MPHSALCGSAASTVEQLNRHQVVFGKSGKHHANTLSVPVARRDARSVLMQNISPLLKTRK